MGFKSGETSPDIGWYKRIVHVPADTRDLTGGVRQATVRAATLRQLIDELERLYPGIRRRLVDGDELRAGLAVALDSDEHPGTLDMKLGEAREIFFVHAISGGSAGVGFVRE